MDDSTIKFNNSLKEIIIIKKKIYSLEKVMTLQLF